MIDPLEQVFATLRTQMDAEKAQAQRGSRFADEARWTASNQAIEQLLREHFATTQEPESQRFNMLNLILMEIDENRNDADDLLDRDEPITDDEVIAAWRTYVGAVDDQAAARTMLYEMVIIDRALDGDDGQRMDKGLTFQIGQQLDTAVELLTKQRVSAKLN